MTKETNADDYFRDLLSEATEIPADKDASKIEIKVPPFYDEEKFKRAQKLYQANVFAMFSGMLTGLLAILAVPTILDVLIHTKQSSTAMTAYRRYMATTFHTLNWYREELKPGSKSWKSLEAVRKMHFLSSRMSQEGGIGMISQKDLAVTQFGFMGYIVLRGKKLGLQANEADLDAVVHFWRVIGYMIGIQDKYNLCTESLETTLPRLDVVSSKLLRPALHHPTAEFVSMATATIEGLWCFNPFLNTDAYLFHTKRLTDVPHHTYSEEPAEEERQIFSKMGWYSRAVVWLQVFTYETLLNIGFFRGWLNYQLIVSEYIIKWFPFLAFPKFGFRNSYVRI